jgi:hypothetical protein
MPKEFRRAVMGNGPGSIQASLLSNGGEVGNGTFRTLHSGLFAASSYGKNSIHLGPAEHLRELSQVRRPLA